MLTPERRKSAMQNKNLLKKKLATMVAGVLKNFATMEANTTCPLLGYQPKEPQNVKKLRKF